MFGSLITKLEHKSCSLYLKFSSYLHFGNSKVSISKSNGECSDFFSLFLLLSTISPISSHFFLSGESSDLGQREKGREGDLLL